MRQQVNQCYASLVWPGMPLLIMVVLWSFPSLAYAQGGKSTPTMTVTATVTPTVTPTDSLNVFETPNTPTPDPQMIYISEPVEGSLAQNHVSITGKTEVNGFSRSEVEFSYNNSPVETWFLLSRSDQPVKDGQLAIWDTSSITDGDYSIRLRVFFTDGSWRDASVPGIRVRNYTSTQTPMSTPTERIIPTTLPTGTFTPTSSPMPTPSPFPENMAELSMPQVLSSLGRGALITVVLFILFGLVLRIHSTRQ
jgi:carbohydrate-binding DOMON domain-containing protein